MGTLMSSLEGRNTEELSLIRIGYKLATNVVIQESERLEELGVISGDPNIYWKKEAIRKVDSLLTEGLNNLNRLVEASEPAVGDDLEKAPAMGDDLEKESKTE